MVSDTDRSKNSPIRLGYYVWILAIVWTGIVAALLVWTIFHTWHVTQEMATNEARAHFNKDQAFRFWGTSHDGVYVPAGERTPPNPYLAHFPERDIETPSGMRLTLMNHAHMMRQMSEEYAHLYGVLGRITSLKPLRPENAPDDWERAALEAFEQGRTEVQEFTEIDGEPYLRLMRPLIARKPCLKCHGHQGYQEGKTLGGVGVSLPMAPFLAHERRNVSVMVLSLGLLWLLGLGGIRLGSRRLMQRIRERNCAETAVRKSRAFLQTIIDGFPELLMVIDRNDRIVLANRAVRNMAEGKDPVSDNLACYQVFHHSGSPCLEAGHPCPMEQVVSAKAPVTVTHTHVDADGNETFMEIAAAPVFDEAGEVAQIIETCRDITERKRAEEERRLLEDQLRHAHKMEAIGTLAAGVAHDFNNLLTAMFGYTDLVRANLPEGSPASPSLDGIEQAARQAGTVTKSLLTFSRRTTAEKVPVDLVPVVANSIHLLRHVLPDSIEVVTDVPLDPLWVKADATQIQQVLMNLAVNARDAMPDGGVLSVSVYARDADGPDGTPNLGVKRSRTAVFVVEDTGTGIPAELQTRVFEPFFTTKSRGQGTGLGMSVVHGIITDHDGRIEIDSGRGKGTRVVVSLPCCDPPGLQSAPAADGHEAMSSGGLVLLAEDNLQVHGIIAASLHAAGYEVLQAFDGIEAVSAFEAHRQTARLAVLDMDLPKRGGLSCLERMRRSQPDLPAILITGNVDASLDDQHSDGTTLLCKPFKMSDLITSVNRALAQVTAGKVQDAKCEDSSG